MAHGDDAGRDARAQALVDAAGARTRTPALDADQRAHDMGTPGEDRHEAMLYCPSCRGVHLNAAALLAEIARLRRERDEAQRERDEAMATAKLYATDADDWRDKCYAAEAAAVEAERARRAEQAAALAEGKPDWLSAAKRVTRFEWDVPFDGPADLALRALREAIAHAIAQRDAEARALAEGRAVRVRVPVLAFHRDGIEWAVSGRSSADEATNEIELCDFAEHWPGRPTAYITAVVPVPQPATVEGEVEAGEGDGDAE